MTSTPNAIQCAAIILRDAGWTVTPPAADMPPDVAVGQVWRSPKPRVENRTVVGVLNEGSYDWVKFTTPHRRGGITLFRNWNTWVRKTGARPV